LVTTRIAGGITHWCQHKHAPLVPRLDDHMSDITNARRSDATLATFHRAIASNLFCNDAHRAKAQC
jgi:hypothetical protein